jgi:AcrR family transcriptional regulator
MVCMSRPRFHRLDPAQQNVLLDAALREFAAHGFASASLNRNIESAGVSKGAMYYYFDGKEDLYADVIRRQLERLLENGGALPVPTAHDANEFWETIEGHYLRLMRSLIATPETGTLLRDWLTGPAAPALRDAQHEAERATMPWLIQTIEAGQRAGAVRTDLPVDLLVAVALGMGQAMDTWLISRPSSESDLSAAVHSLIGMMRRALEVV